MMKTANYMLLACAVFERECKFCVQHSHNNVELKIIDQGLHDVGEQKMSSALQAEIDEVDCEKYDAILLAYGLCNNGIRGLRSQLPMVVPRAHDCITLLMGSRENYRRHFDDNPGTYYLSVGWVENSKSHFDNPQSTTSGMGLATYREYVEKYGEENAAYLMETMGDWLQHYSKLAYIDTHVPGAADYSEQERNTAAERGWEFEKIDGNVDMIMRMLNGLWDENDFLVIPPGETIIPSHNDSVIEAADINRN
jgi:hypothetical protein